MSESTNPWEALECAVEQGRRYGRRADHFEERALAAEAKIRAVEDVLDSIDTSAEPALHDGFADIHRDQMQENT